MKMKTIKIFLCAAPVIICLFFSSCEMFGYGKLGGADKTDTYYPGDDEFETLLSSLSGVWYSHYAGIGRLDGYRLGRWKDFDTLVPAAKLALFPDLLRETYDTSGSADPNGYFVFYDDTVYGQKGDDTGGNGGWGIYYYRYAGIVRAVNIFDRNINRGSIIIEYLKGCAPNWDRDIKYGQRPFFGIYYRVLNSDTVQMANAVDLTALYAGKKYYTETETLKEATDLNTIENEAEFISWGVVIPQNREPRQ
jgi:hypothetical protein